VAWQQAHPTTQPASGGAPRSTHVRRRKAAVRQSRSSAEGSPANPKSLDGVVHGRELGSGGGGSSQNLPAEAGREAQYYDQSHFIKEFKRFTGLTPHQYQEIDNEFGKAFSALQ
jgi:AraC-like DNA-binding protein